MTHARLLTPLLALLLLVACSVAPPPPEVETLEIDGLTTQVVEAIVPLPPLTIRCPVDMVGFVDIDVVGIGGTTASGADFLFYVPGQLHLPSLEPADHWNQSLVLYARGYLPTSDPVGFPDPLPADVIALRDALLCGGFAVGASSYSANGLAIEEGIVDTHLLNPIFAANFGAPSRTYVMGHSMGGLISLALMESFPGTYDGALPMCGPTAGSLAQLQYLGHVRVLVDYFFPSLFRENAVTPTAKTMQQVEAAVDRLAPPQLLRLASVHLPGSEPYGGVPILPVDPTATTPAAQLQSLRASLKEALYYYVVGMQDVLDRGGGQPFDNTAIVYTSSSLSPVEMRRLNERVDRFGADFSALAYWSMWYQPTGKVLNPTINLHTLFDPDVPYAHAFLYEQRAVSEGNAGNLLTVPVARYGHCAFTTEEIVGGFGLLLEWVETGDKPTLP
jgi:pimeloyl-ACP methyl ester carboxylesterase